MGTRADFYVGRGAEAEWLGSIAWDGYPDGNPEPVLGTATEEAYRAAVGRMLDEERDHATLPDMGWPWPWNDSATTDFAYAWDDGVWISSFGHSWVKAGEYDPDDDSGAKDATFPDMAARKALTLGPRSGVLVLEKQVYTFPIETDPEAVAAGYSRKAHLVAEATSVEDARLIAAAPDLADVVRQFVFTFERLFPFASDPKMSALDAFPGLNERARALLSRIRGEA